MQKESFKKKWWGETKHSKEEIRQLFSYKLEYQRKEKYKV